MKPTSDSAIAKLNSNSTVPDLIAALREYVDGGKSEDLTHYRANMLRQIADDMDKQIEKDRADWADRQIRLEQEKQKHLAKAYS